MKNNKLIKKFLKLGILKSVKGAIRISFNVILQKFYGFDKWHIFSGYHLQPYKTIVVKLVDSVKPRSVLELGCGLGDVLANVNAPIKIGIDPDEQVIKAAKILNKQYFLFCTGHLSDTKKILEERKIETLDIIVLINWVHNLKFSELKRHLISLIEKHAIKYIVIDLIYSSMDGYKYKHSVEDLKKFGKVIKVIGGGDGVREIALVSTGKGVN